MKVTIVGTGHVGSTLAYVSVLRGLAEKLVLVNRDDRKARGHALDLRHTAAMMPSPTQITTGGVDASAESDVVVFTISCPMPKDRPDRRVMAEENAVLIREWLPALSRVSPNAVFLIVTNPVDVMTWATLQVTDLPPERVCGIGTLVDSARFRAMMSDEIGIHADDIRAYILGEHGASQVAAISLASVGGEPIDTSLEKAHQFAQETTEAGIDIFRLKGYTNFGIATSTALVIEAIKHDKHHTMPLSVELDGFCGIADVCLSIPVVIGRNGVTRRLKPRLTDEEQKAFTQSAEAIRAINQQILPILNENGS
ncbi:MAG: hypothetical protein NXI04_10960 [Planctomycetaceae bacterium]|nr:hypothetical protein [Planctomycetaceae bacterium]